MSRLRVLRVAELISGPLAEVTAQTALLPRRISAAVAELPVGVLVTLEEQRGALDRRPRWFALARLRSRLAEIERHSTRLTVVAAAIIRDHRVLIAQRDHPAEWAGRWEFPGGKVERGETAELALVREVAEELGAQVDVGARLARHELADGAILLLFEARLRAGSPEPTALEHQALDWAAAGDLQQRDWAGTNGGFVTEVTGRL
ncbi:MAG TPA: (deoxy)nucleoside triphosphate pyrophosphohydrolase [Jatrophihabitans sp.]|nr:(deoxy)nucleoside triphosphate pyrophosphohydrolase [Jatrophihabitans sp.]